MRLTHAENGIWKTNIRYSCIDRIICICPVSPGFSPRDGSVFELLTETNLTPQNEKNLGDEDEVFMGVFYGRNNEKDGYT